jgi:prevent-host-death family protein
MSQVNVHEAKIHLPKLLTRVAAGEEIVVSKAGKPIARLVPWERDAISPLPVQHVHALHVSKLPHHHKDPFDRLIICQAMIERIPIMTVDVSSSPMM